MRAKSTKKEIATVFPITDKFHLCCSAAMAGEESALSVVLEEDDSSLVSQQLPLRQHDQPLSWETLLEMGT